MPQKIVDLTVTLSNNMPGHRFFPRPVILPHFTHDEMETWGNGTPEDPLGGCTTYLGMIDHMGTHIDAFIHNEWLCNLEELLGKGEFYFQGLPLKIDKGSGSPVRAIALVD